MGSKSDTMEQGISPTSNAIVMALIMPAAVESITRCVSGMGVQLRQLQWYVTALFCAFTILTILSYSSPHLKLFLHIHTIASCKYQSFVHLENHYSRFVSYKDPYTDITRKTFGQSHATVVHFAAAVPLFYRRDITAKLEHSPCSLATSFAARECPKLLSRKRIHHRRQVWAQMRLLLAAYVSLINLGSLLANPSAT